MSKWYLKCSYNTSLVSGFTTGCNEKYLFFFVFLPPTTIKYTMGWCAHPPFLDLFKLPTQRPLIKRAIRQTINYTTALPHSHPALPFLFSNFRSISNHCNSAVIDNSQIDALVIESCWSPLLYHCNTNSFRKAASIVLMFISLPFSVNCNDNETMNVFMAMTMTCWLYWQC